MKILESAFSHLIAQLPLNPPEVGVLIGGCDDLVHIYFLDSSVNTTVRGNHVCDEYDSVLFHPQH